MLVFIVEFVDSNNTHFLLLLNVPFTKNIHTITYIFYYVHTITYTYLAFTTHLWHIYDLPCKYIYIYHSFRQSTHQQSSTHLNFIHLIITYPKTHEYSLASIPSMPSILRFECRFCWYYVFFGVMDGWIRNVGLLVRSTEGDNVGLFVRCTVVGNGVVGAIVGVIVGTFVGCDIGQSFTDIILILYLIYYIQFEKYIMILQSRMYMQLFLYPLCLILLKCN